MTFKFIATFENNPSIDDIQSFSDSHGVSYRKIKNQTFEFASENYDYLEESRDQLIALNPSEIE